MRQAKNNVFRLVLHVHADFISDPIDIASLLLHHTFSYKTCYHFTSMCSSRNTLSPLQRCLQSAEPFTEDNYKYTRHKEQS